MPQPIVGRIALRAVQLAIAAAGIFVIMLLFSRQAHAAASDTLPPASPLSAVTSAVSSAVPTEWIFRSVRSGESVSSTPARAFRISASGQ